MVSINPAYLKRYKDIAKLLFKYGRSDLVKDSPLATHLDSNESKYSETQEPEEFASDIEQLGPTFIKLGQVLSTRPDILPESFLKSLSRLQDDVEPFSFSEVQEILDQDLGADSAKLFTSFEEKPLASASIGQVHRAITRSGQEVVVKIQRPGIREEVNKDIEALGDIASFFDNHTSVGKKYEFSRIVNTLSESLIRELDYQKEKQNLKLMRKNLSKFDSLIIPRPYEQLSSSRILTMDYIKASKITALNPVVLLEVDGEHLAAQLFEAYLHQVIVYGFFHADPHPGNIHLTEDRNIAILDLGMVANLEARHRDILLSLLLAISKSNGKQIVDAAIKIGSCKEEFCIEKFSNDIENLLLEHQPAQVSELNTGRIVIDIQRVAAGAGLRLPNSFTMLGKALLNLDKVISVLDPSFNPRQAIEENAPKLLSLRMKQSLSTNNLYQALISSGNFIESLPSRLDTILGNLANNEFKVDVDGIDENKLVKAFQKIANRITAGLLLSSMIVGASLIMDIKTKYSILGYPAAAIILLTASAVGAFYLIFNSLFTDE